MLSKHLCLELFKYITDHYFFNVETRGRLGTCRCVRNAYFITLKITSNCALKCNLICSNLKHYMG